MKAFLGGLAMVGVGLVLGCGDVASTETNPVPLGGTGAALDAGAMASNGDATDNALNPSQACIDLANKAATDLAPAYEAATKSCATDDDCIVISDADSCDRGCGTIASKAGQPGFDKAIAETNAGDCAAFLSAGCSTLEHGCFAFAGATTPQCIANACAAGYPAAWTSFALQVDSANVLDPTSAPVPCSNTTCHSWSVTPDGNVQESNPMGAKTVTLSAADLATVDTALRDGAFRQGLLQGSSANPRGPFLACTPATDAGATLPSAVASISWTAGESFLGPSGSVSDCVASGASPNSVAVVYAVLQKY